MKDKVAVVYLLLGFASLILNWLAWLMYSGWIDYAESYHRFLLTGSKWPLAGLIFGALAFGATKKLTKVFSVLLIVLAAYTLTSMLHLYFTLKNLHPKEQQTLERSFDKAESEKR